ncbi:MAG: hypothetical protein LAQ69_21850 [Acidobacteriia bacterium]|nr:hypothetical protein [Terriglobia bacterium]
MTLMQFVKPAGALAAFGLIGFAAMSIISPRVQADSNSDVQIGFAIAPVQLNLKGKNPALVGKGSYIVNAKADCNGCHNSLDLGGEWAAGHNPYFGQPKMVNAKGYLGGGSPFGPFPGQGIGGVGPLIIYSRNLTPDASGLPEGGHTFQEFLTIFRTGHDFDLAHPACPTLGAAGCIASPPFNASLLQVMPWPVYSNMSDDDLQAVYEYLSAIPCISHKGTVGLPSNLYQTCP